MRFLALFRPAPPRTPGRHSAQWADMQRGLVELQERAHGFEQQCAGLQAERDAEKQRHLREITGWQDSLRLAGAQCRGIAADLERAEAERDRLQRLLDASDGRPSHHVDAPIEQGCRDTPQAAADTVQASLAEMVQDGDERLLDLLSGLRQDRGPRPPIPAKAVAKAVVRPLWEQHSAPPAEVSPVTGERAREAVHAALGGRP